MKKYTKGEIRGNKKKREEEISDHEIEGYVTSKLFVPPSMLHSELGLTILNGYCL
jgi:hypothetical protein